MLNVWFSGGLMYPILTAIGVLCVFCACESAKEIELDGAHDPVLSVQVFYTLGEDSIDVIVGTTVGLYEVPFDEVERVVYYYSPEGALDSCIILDRVAKQVVNEYYFTIKNSRGEVVLEQRCGNCSTTRWYIDSTSIHANEEYFLYLESPGFSPVESSTNGHNNFELRLTAFLDDGIDQKELLFELMDNKGTKDYYLIDYVFWDTLNMRAWRVDYFPNNFDINYQIGYGFTSMLDDEYFDGRSLNSKLFLESLIYVTDNEEEEHEIPTNLGRQYIEFLRIPSDVYEYYYSLGAIGNGDELGFIEPTSIKSNVRGGVGLFAIYGSQRIELPKE